MFDAITLEVSLKPFKKTDEKYIRGVCREIFAQWRPLLKGREEISLLLWTGDGSELLDYDGNEDGEFEWGCYIGTANLPLAAEEDDPAVSLHEKKRYYIDDPPKMTYGILKSIVGIIREEGKNHFPDAKIRIGSIFDIGPEFAVSDFKYARHTEICSGAEIDKLRFVDSTALLNADRRAYAAYPEGIPQGLPFATFLGAQTKAFFADMGLDYIWLSNGLGFSADPWKQTGKIFDGERFRPDKLKNTADKVFSFWKLFREACPDIPVETRGTNNSAGIDYATDGVPLCGIYGAGFGILPPPNSPWAAINGNYGLELMGHMTRICDLPGKDWLFRYYLHDPWWMNSPWYDRYDGCASDIYLPMSISRIDENGKTKPANRFSIFTVDNSKGNMPDSCVNEVIPHVLKAEKDCPDEPPFLIWLYPMKEYTSSESENDLCEMYTGDRYVMNAVNEGLPLNTVVSTDAFSKMPPDVYDGRVILAPCIHNGQSADRLSAFAGNGGRVILYGTSSGLADCSVSGENVVRADMEGAPSALREALSRFGYEIRFETQEDFYKLPVIALNRSDNALFFSVYNPDTTTDTLLRFPLGAPILLGCDALMVDGYAKYGFSRCEHRECRVFVRQKDGIIPAHEAAPVSEKYRRRFNVGGLKDATVYYFPEKYCERFIAVATNSADRTPILDGDWTPVYDKIMGWGFKGEHKNGKLSFLMPFEK
ncbi:MAG: hypothetical protein J5940_05715, partial [Clostridia bacterium]|nr:hypothetical protein [Clostridia bacterium]